MSENKNMIIEISGHTDSQGNDNDNMALSINRAESVVNYLKDNNIKEQRLIIKGFGETKPIDDNNTEKGRKNNRRVELKILKN